jgi:formate dehydrogenase subunit beta
MRAFVSDLLKKGSVDAVLMPVRVPAGDSYAWILMSDPAIVEEANPVAPVMPTHGAKALKALTRKGEGSIRVLALMRPCEIKGSIELTKLNQVHLDNIILASYDCPGAIPLKDYDEDPEEAEKRFDGFIDRDERTTEGVKRMCGICTDFSFVDSDIHFGRYGTGGKMVVIARTEKGAALVEEDKDEVTRWAAMAGELIGKAKEARKAAAEETGSMVRGLDGMVNTFANCIGCHNCQSACPICYCRQCYFDSEVSVPEPEALHGKSEVRGGISFPRDRVLFHTGRMAHMTLSCVSCGQCSDACPVFIPVASVFGYMADEAQPVFEYEAGRNDGKPIPLRTYHEDEVPMVKELLKGSEEVLHE